MVEKLQPTIMLAEKILADTPPDHFLTGEVRVAPDKLSLEATAIFPSSIPSVGERGHVNAIHFINGAYNAAHILRELNGYNLTLTKRVTCRGENLEDDIRFTSPDQPMKLKFELFNIQDDGRMVYGDYKSTYTINGVVHAVVTSQIPTVDKPGFVAVKKKQTTV